MKRLSKKTAAWGTEIEHEPEPVPFLPDKPKDEALLGALRAVYADAVASGKRDHPLYLSLAEQIAKLEGK